MKKNKMRRSDKIIDTRNNAALAFAHDNANKVRQDIDDGVLMQHTARIIDTPQQRKIEKELTYLLDAMGTKGKGRYGGGRLNSSRFDAAIERAKWRWRGTMGEKK